MASKFKVVCNECGKKFKMSNPDSCCPKCGGVDLEVDEYVVAYSNKWSGDPFEAFEMEVA